MTQLSGDESLKKAAEGDVAGLTAGGWDIQLSSETAGWLTCRVKRAGEEAWATSEVQLTDGIDVGKCLQKAVLESVLLGQAEKARAPR